MVSLSKIALEIAESDRHVITMSIAQELNMAQKTVWNHLNKAGYELTGIKPHGPNFQQRIVAESQQNLS